MGPKTKMAENEFNARMTSLILTLMEAINAQQDTRIRSKRKPSKTLFRWYDELADAWPNYGPIQ